MKYRLLTALAVMVSGCATAGPAIPVPPVQFDHVPAGYIAVDEFDYYIARRNCSVLAQHDPREFSGACVQGNRVIVARAGVDGMSQADHDRALRAEYGKINQRDAGLLNWQRTDGRMGWSFRP